MENNIPSATHQEKAKKMKKLRRWQIAVSLLGVAIIVWGVIEVVCLFLNYSQTETTMPFSSTPVPSKRSLIPNCAAAISTN